MLDMAINGRGFTIQMPDGTIGYTRDGTFKLDDQGQLVTSQGFLVDPPIITVPQGAKSISVSKDGIVSVVLPGQTQPQQIGQMQLADFINPQGLEPIGGNLYLETAASGAPTVANPTNDGTGAIQQTFLEASNVNVTEELVEMIQAQRALRTQLARHQDQRRHAGPPVAAVISPSRRMIPSLDGELSAQLFMVT